MSNMDASADYLGVYGVIVIDDNISNALRLRLPEIDPLARYVTRLVAVNDGFP